MNTYLIELTPRSPLKSIPSSDTLFGAICWGIRTIYGTETLESLLSNFPGDDRKFILSSSFPAHTRKGIYFLPFPFSQELVCDDIFQIANDCFRDKKFPQVPDDDLPDKNIFLADFKKQKECTCYVFEEYRKFKKIRYLSVPLFKRFFTQGKNFLSSLFTDYLTGKAVRKEVDRNLPPQPEEFGGNIKVISDMGLTNEEFSLLFADSPYKIFSENVIIARNKIDRLTMSVGEGGELFFDQRIFIYSEFSLYFLLKTQNIDFLKPVFRWLEHTGIGGDRSSGCGQFKIPEPRLLSNFTRANTNNVFITLSRYLPADNELEFSAETAYELLPYWPRLESRFEFANESLLLKDRIIYFKEGSVFKTTQPGREYYGQLLPVKKFNGTTIYQNGLAFPISAEVEIK